MIIMLPVGNETIVFACLQLKSVLFPMDHLCIPRQVYCLQVIFTTKHLKSQLWTSSAGKNFPNIVFTLEFEKFCAALRKSEALTKQPWPLVLELASLLGLILINQSFRKDYFYQKIIWATII